MVERFTYTYSDYQRGWVMRADRVGEYTLYSEFEKVKKQRDRAEEHLVRAWNAFGKTESDISRDDLVETAEEYYDMINAAGGDIAEQIICLETMISSLVLELIAVKEQLREAIDERT